MRSTRLPTLTLYSVWERKHDGDIDPLGCTEYPGKQTAIAELRELRKQYPSACLVKTMRTVCPDKRKNGER